MISKATLALTALLALGPVLAGAAPQKTQSFDLHPGWNSVFLEVEPQPNDLPTALQGVPFLSAWTWNPRLSPVDFISDPSEGLFNKPGWLGHFASGPEAATPAEQVPASASDDYTAPGGRELALRRARRRAG